MRAKYKFWLVGLLGLAVVTVAAIALRGHPIAVLAPKGTIAEQERGLILFAALLALIVVVPVFALTVAIVWRYRAGNKKARYTPDAEPSENNPVTYYSRTSKDLYATILMKYIAPGEMNMFANLFGRLTLDAFRHDPIVFGGVVGMTLGNYHMATPPTDDYIIKDEGIQR